MLLSNYIDRSLSLTRCELLRTHGGNAGGVSGITYTDIYFSPASSGADGDGTSGNPYTLSSSVQTAIGSGGSDANNWIRVYVSGLHDDPTDNRLLVNANAKYVTFVSDPSDPAEFIHCFFKIAGDDVGWTDLGGGVFEYTTSGWNSSSPDFMFESGALTATYANCSDTLLTPAVSAAAVSSPGDVYLDSATNKLTVAPTDGVIANHTYFVPRPSSWASLANGHEQITIDGIKVAFCNTNDGFVRFDRVGLTVKNCDFKWCDGIAMFLGTGGFTGTCDIFINDNKFDNCGYGVYFQANGGHINNIQVLRNRFTDIGNNASWKYSTDNHAVGIQGMCSNVLIQHNVVDKLHGTAIVIYYENISTTYASNNRIKDNIVKNIAEYFSSGITVHAIMISGDNDMPADQIDDLVVSGNICRDVSSPSATEGAGIRVKSVINSSGLPVEITGNYLADSNIGFTGDGASTNQSEYYEHANYYIGNTVQSDHQDSHADNTAVRKNDNEFYEVDVYKLEGTQYTSLSTYQTACNGVLNATDDEINSTYTASGTTIRSSMATAEAAIEALARSA